MEKEIKAASEVVLALMKNAALSIRLEGWPAAVAAVSIFGIFAFAYSFKPTQLQVVYVSEKSCVKGDETT